MKPPCCDSWPGRLTIICRGDLDRKKSELDNREAQQLGVSLGSMTAPVVAHNYKEMAGCIPSSDKCTPKPSIQRVMVPYQELVQLMPRSHFCHGELLITGLE